MCKVSCECLSNCNRHCLSVTPIRLTLGKQAFKSERLVPDIDLSLMRLIKQTLSYFLLILLCLNRLTDSDDDTEEGETTKQYELRSTRPMERIPLKEVLTRSEMVTMTRRKRKSRAKITLKKKTPTKAKSVSIAESIELEGELRKNFVTERFKRPEANMLPPQPVLKATSVEPSKGRYYLKYLPRATIDMNDFVGREAINTLPSTLPLADITTLGSQWEEFEAFHITGTPFR